MKKTLLLIMLSLFIVGTMAAGTMSQYVKTQSVTVNPQFKTFNFTAATAASQSISLKMAPGEMKTWTINLSNSENGVSSETAMLVRLVLTLKDVPYGMAFYVNGAPYVSGGVVAALKGGVSDTATIMLTAVWNTSEDAYDTNFQGYLGATVELTFTATQTTDFVALQNFSVLKDGTNRVSISFQMPAPINLDDANSDITIEYYRIVDGQKQYVLTKSGNPLIKSKTWGGYLNDAATEVKYSRGSDSPTLSNSIANGVVLGSTVDPNYATMNYVNGTWVTDNNSPLFVAVTVNINGKIYQSIGSV